MRAVAALFNHLERNVGTPVLEAIESERPELAVSIRNLMFVFDDLARVDDNGLRELVQRADKKTLTIALKGASEDLRQRIFDNMSKRAAEMMREEMDVMGRRPRARGGKGAAGNRRGGPPARRRRGDRDRWRGR